MSMREKFMKEGGIKELYSGRISNDPRKGYKEIAKGQTDNVKFNEHGYTNDSLIKTKSNEGR